MADQVQAGARVLADDVLRFAKEALARVGVIESVAELTARGLWQTSLRGVDSHGIRLLPHYVAATEAGRINPDPQFRFDATAASTGVLDADHGFGHAAGITAMRRAVELAREAGVGMVAIKRSTHCGALAYYAFEACEAEMIGLAFTHATSRVRSANGVRPLVGTNPMCFAAPMANEGPFCFDAAPTPLTFNAIKRHREAAEPLPRGCAADEEGRETLDPDAAAQLLPIGDYKGFGWSLMVDVLCGLLSGMPVGQAISSMYGDPLTKKRNLGHFVGAIRIDTFEPVDTFKSRLKEFADLVRAEPRADENRPVQVPGDPEKAHEADRRLHGIPLSVAEHENLAGLAARLGLPPLVPAARGNGGTA